MCAAKAAWPPTFRKEEHGLRRLRVHRICGLVFGTLSAETPSFEEYVGPDLDRQYPPRLRTPLRVLGHYSQKLPSNWKLYIENVKDPYHASILHAFNSVMKQDRLTMEGGIMMGARGWHHISYSKMLTDTGGEIYETAADALGGNLGLWLRPAGPLDDRRSGTITVTACR